MSQLITKQVEELIQKDLDGGKFYSICSNETTFKNYVIKQTLPQILDLIRGEIEKIPIEDPLGESDEYDLGLANMQEKIINLLK